MVFSLIKALVNYLREKRLMINGQGDNVTMILFAVTKLGRP